MKKKQMKSSPQKWKTDGRRQLCHDRKDWHNAHCSPLNTRPPLSFPRNNNRQRRTMNSTNFLSFTHAPHSPEYYATTATIAHVGVVLSGIATSIVWTGYLDLFSYDFFSFWRFASFLAVARGLYVMILCETDRINGGYGSPFALYLFFILVL